MASDWFTGREFVELFAIARVTPGPGSMITALIGWRVAGIAGALVATIALYLPAAMLCFLVARIWNRYRGTRLHTAIECLLDEKGWSSGGRVLTVTLGSAIYPRDAAQPAALAALAQEQADPALTAVPLPRAA